MDISVIFATYKRHHLLEKTLKSFLTIQTNTYTWEMIVADNAGDPDTEDIVNKFIGLLPLKYLIVKNRGKNNALNRAVSEAQGKLFIFTDDDVLVEPNWLIEMWEGALRWPENHIFGGRILPKYPDGQKPPFDHQFFGWAFAIADWGILEGHYEADKVWGPNMAVRASVFKEGWRFNTDVGPDGTSYYMSGSETDLTTRLERAGYRAVYLPRSMVYHQIRNEQMTFKWLYKRAFRFGKQNAHLEQRADGHTLFGIPRHLIQRVCKAYLKFILSFLSKDKKIRFERGLFYWETRGNISWYRRRGIKCHS